MYITHVLHTHLYRILIIYKDKLHTLIAHSSLLVTRRELSQPPVIVHSSLLVTRRELSQPPVIVHSSLLVTRREFSQPPVFEPSHTFLHLLHTATERKPIHI